MFFYKLFYLKSNYASVNRNKQQFIDEELRPTKYRKSVFRMRVGHLDVEVDCVKKQEGRQLAAQKILKVEIANLLIVVRISFFFNLNFLIT